MSPGQTEQQSSALSFLKHGGNYDNVRQCKISSTCTSVHTDSDPPTFSTCTASQIPRRNLLRLFPSFKKQKKANKQNPQTTKQKTYTRTLIYFQCCTIIINAIHECTYLVGQNWRT